MFRYPLSLEPGEIVAREPFVWRDLVAWPLESLGVTLGGVEG
jgi:hypothetical protein